MSRLGVILPPPGTLRLLAGERVGWSSWCGVGRGQGYYRTQRTGRLKTSVEPRSRSAVVGVSEVRVRSFLEVATLSYACLYPIHTHTFPSYWGQMPPVHNGLPC